jgi:imidazoleglycerol-phosphate dehydratase
MLRGFLKHPKVYRDMGGREATVERKTNETDISLMINLDGTGKSDLRTGIPFFEHMLDQVARHGLIDMTLEAKGDLEIDDHHTVEDVGIVLGGALAKAIGDKTGVYRYGHAYVPLDESLSRVVIDFSGRPGLFYRVDYPRARIGAFDVDLLREFFQGFVNHAHATVHIDNLTGLNAHHVAETIFKAFGRALRMAVTRDERMAGVIPSTKGSL